MMRTAFIQNNVADHDQKFLALPRETARQRVLASHIDQPFSHPLPELSLSGPKLVVIGADYSRRLLCFHSMPVGDGQFRVQALACSFVRAPLRSKLKLEL